jgi:hypothetical protein
MSFEVSTASADEMTMMARWATEEGWNVAHTDPLAFHAADPGGFLIGRVDGEPLLSISAVKQGPDFGFVGFYIARPKARGKGYGIKIWNAGMALLKGRNVALDGVVAQQENYRKSGFKLAWNNSRYEGPAGNARPPAGVSLVDARSVPFDKLAAYDRRFVVAERNAFLALWIGLEQRASLVAIRDGEIAGFAVMRGCPASFKVGPLFADSPEIAASLIASLAEKLSPPAVVMDVPDFNKPALALVEQMGWLQVSSSARMYTGAVPALDRAGMYAVTSLELG